jgi:hypothetical protein
VFAKEPVSLNLPTKAEPPKIPVAFALACKL